MAANLTIDGTEVFVKENGVIRYLFPGPHHTFTIRAEHHPISGTTNADSNNTTTDQFTIYAGENKVWGVSDEGYVYNRRPAFQVAGTQQIANANLLNWRTVITNDGNHFNNRTGIFTAPITGTYYFILSFTGQDSTNPMYPRFYINNVEYSPNMSQMHADAGPGDGADVQSNMTIFLLKNLDAGDYASVRIHSNSTFYPDGIIFAGWLF